MQTYGPAPLAFYNPSDEWTLRQDNAEQKLVATCMTQAGFTYATKAPNIATVPGTDWDDFLGVTDMTQAETLGHVSPAYSGASKGVDAKQQAASTSPEESTPAYLVALYGAATARTMQGLPDDPSLNDNDGCLTKADAALTPRIAKPDLEIQAEGWAAAKASAQADATVIADEALWKTCMLQAGYQVTSIPQATDTQVTSTAVSKAVADVTCKETAGLTDAYITTLYAAEREYITQHQSDFDAMQAYLGAQDQLATQVLAGK